MNYHENHKKLSNVKSLSQLALFKGGHEISGKSSKAGFECHSSRFIEKQALSRGMVPTPKNMALAHLDPVAAFGRKTRGDVGPGVCACGGVRALKQTVLGCVVYVW